VSRPEVLLLAAVKALSTSLAFFTAVTYLLSNLGGGRSSLIGWAAASGFKTSSRAWILYGLLFLWQISSLHGNRFFPARKLPLGKFRPPIVKSHDCHLRVQFLILILRKG
jgi:hypothetical protein